MNTGEFIATSLGAAVLLPLLSFFLILVFGPKMGKSGEHASGVAIAAIGLSAVLSFLSLFVWLTADDAAVEVAGADSSHGTELVVRGQEPDADHAAGHQEGEAGHGDDHAHGDDAHGDHGHDDHGHHAVVPRSYSGEFALPGLGPWVLGEFGELRLSISYYVDALTVSMFCMVTFIATLIHIYATGYMHEELEAVTDHEVTTSDGHHLHRPGRYHRFFQYLSLFCFSMLGLVIAGNIAMVFVFWELVGICSYFLIGFYVERKSASTAANKAFIVNRVGDFGMIIGLMALWTGLGTFSFGNIDYNGNGSIESNEQGMFSLVRPGGDNHYQLQTPAGMVKFSASDQIAALAADNADTFDDAHAATLATQAEADARVDTWRKEGYGYGLLIVAGIGIFCGCVGKSAQFPLHTWLPDAMEGPTPVSALVHSATMVAAGVYLVGRFYPVFAPEVLFVIAIIGCITLFMAATIAITATDIKRVLAYSTVSQLGYMMMALGVGGWLAGMMHLVTHAFFKSLLFMGSGSVIHAVHTNEMTEMGGLRKKMPVTAYTMLVGCLAIAGAGIPFIMSLFGEHLKGLGFAGFYSKDAILEQAYSFMGENAAGFAGLFFFAAAGGAAITAFYMFRMWYLTFAGKPRNQERYDHAHESPAAMYAPLIILSAFAVGVAWSPMQGIVGGIIAVVIGYFFWQQSGGEDEHASDHAHDDHAHGHDDHAHGGLPAFIGQVPMAVAAFALLVAIVWQMGVQDVTLGNLLESARPVGTLTAEGVWMDGWQWPDEHASHADHIVIPVSLIAIGTAFTGFLLATIMYGLGWLNPEEARRQFAPVYNFLINKWWFDELYDFVFVKPTHFVSGLISAIDKRWIDWLIDNLALATRRFSTFWAWISDKMVVDFVVDKIAAWTYSIGVSLRSVQTGRLRQYVMFIVVGAVALFLLISIFWTPSIAG